MTENPYIYFVEIGDTGRTKIWGVFSRRSGEQLASIKWYGGWRQYIFVPERGTIWNTGCLTSINDFITEQMAARNG